MHRTHEKERVAALSAGLAITVLVWLAAEAFTPDWIASLGEYSIWFYGPVSLAAWALASVISYALIIRAQRRNPALCPEHEEKTRATRMAATGDLSRVPECEEEVDAAEKDKLAALMGGFAITIAVWLAALSFAPEGWLDAIQNVSPWVYSVASMALWSVSAELMYLGFRRSRHHSSIPHAH
ncbi:MAG: hypothetical protein ACLQDV_21730 [Candidatus Binataceae bacterium]